MSEIDVEAVESLDDVAAVDAPEYVLYGGKGGVGKTTMAAATALASAREGVATLAVSTDPAHSLSDTLEQEVPAEPARVHDEYPLYAAEIDPETMSEGLFAPGGAGAGDASTDGEPGAGVGDGGEGGAGVGGGGSGGPDPTGAGALGGLGALLGGEDGVDPFAGGAMPGADEAAAMQLLLEYMDDERFDRVVVDTAPTGHTLRLLELPETMDSLVGKLLALRERLGGLLSGMNPFGEDQEPGTGTGHGPGIDDLTALRERIERLRSVLRDPSRTDFRVVLVPEEMSVVESERLLARLEAFEVPVRTVVVNRVMQDLADVTGVDADWFVAPDLEDCAFCQRRWRVQRSALERAQEVFRGHDVRRVPLFADEVRGEEMLRVVAACLG